MNKLTRGEKIVGALSYIIFFLPIINGNKNDFNRFHANQGLLLFMVIILVNIINNFLLPFSPLFLEVILSIGFLFLIICLFLTGIASAAKGEMKEFLWIGKIKILNNK